MFSSLRYSMANQKSPFFRYCVLAILVAFIGYLTVNSYGGSGDSSERSKLFLVGAVTILLGILTARWIHITSYETAATAEITELDKRLKQVQETVEAVHADVKEIIDKKAEETWTTIKEDYMTTPIKEAYQFLANIMENVKDFGKLDKDLFTTPVPILLTLIKTVQDKQIQDWLSELPARSDLDGDTFKLHHRIAKFACRVYEASLLDDKNAIAKEMGLHNPEHVLLYSFSDNDDTEFHMPKFIVLEDHETKSIVVSIRGTFSATDIIIDMICDDEDFLGGHAHRGIVRGTKLVLSKIMDVLSEALARNEAYKLVITGHSLGAGTAELVAMSLMTENRHLLPESTKISCIALAPPPIYRSSKSVPNTISDNIFIYINGQDCIPRMSLGSLTKLLALVRAVDGLALTGYETFQLITGFDQDKPEFQAKRDLLHNEVMNIKQERFPFLEHPGKVFFLHMSSTENEVKEKVASYFAVRQSSESFSRQLPLLERMVLDHLNTNYLHAFSELTKE